jgi:protease IV
MKMTWAAKRTIVILVVVAFFALIIFAAAWRPARFAAGISSNSVLVIDASGTIDEQKPPDFFGGLTGASNLVLHDYVDAIDSARNDSRITGLVVRIGPLDTGWAKLEEIRTHLIAFQSSGKPSICYLGYDGIGNPEYYLASACKEVWLVPTAQVSVTGMIAEALFLRGTLDKLKIVPEFYHIAEYKTAENELTEKKFTPPHREEVESVLRSVYDQYLTDASQARRLPRAKFEQEVTSGPLLTNEAVQGGLVDRAAYWDEVQDYFKDRYRGWNPISLARYHSFVNYSTGPKIAVVYATGMIVSGDSGNSPTNGVLMGGDTVAAAIRTARTDSSIRAIVLRIDSGGGSVVASEVIRRESELARQQKPLVVSMSDTAASGGYWIAAPATKIVAEPDTITGSIGVLIGKLNLSGLYSLLGLSTDYVATSDNATIFSDQQNFTPQQEAYIQKSLQDTYAQFTRGVAQGRGLPVDAVDKIGKGRIWTGAQAKNFGLVDELGGLDTAVDVAKNLAHISSGQSVEIVRLPEEKSIFQQLFEREQDELNQSQSLAASLRKLVGVMEPVQARMSYELRIH